MVPNPNSFGGTLQSGAKMESLGTDLSRGRKVMRHWLRSAMSAEVMLTVAPMSLNEFI
jgi:hypothetical protein